MLVDGPFPWLLLAVSSGIGHESAVLPMCCFSLLHFCGVISMSYHAVLIFFGRCDGGGHLFGRPHLPF